MSGGQGMRAGDKGSGRVGDGERGRGKFYFNGCAILIFSLDLIRERKY